MKLSPIAKPVPIYELICFGAAGEHGAFPVPECRCFGRRSVMSRMMLLAAVGACLLATGCAMSPCGFGGGACGPAGSCGPRGFCNRGCSDCVPPWMPYLGHYKQRCDDCVTRQTALHCAWRALDEYGYQDAVSGDFAAGFERAYIDLAENRAPQPPSVPPSKYWSAYYRSCAGRPHVEDWYAGYQAGLERGLQGGVSRFNRIDIWTCGNTMAQDGVMAAGMAVTADSPETGLRPGCPCNSR